jgi:metacaspase-1
MSANISILAVHGIGHGKADPQLQAGWTAAITRSLQGWDPDVAVEIDFLAYDELFEHAPLNLAVYLKAVAELAKSGIVHGVEDLSGRSRGLLGTISEKIKWTVGMVAQWATENDLRKQSRNALLNSLRTEATT